MMRRPISIDDFRTHLRMLLSDLPQGTTAELTNYAIAYVNGSEVVFCLLRDDESGGIEEEFDLEDYVWDEWEPFLAFWLENPVYATRPEVQEWLNEAPPREAGLS